MGTRCSQPERSAKPRATWIEAAHLLRAHRSTLPRLGYTDTIDADEIDVLRRIVPAFREPPGPQLLGRTLDYTGRLLDTSDEDTGPPTSPGTGGRPGEPNRHRPSTLPTDARDRPASALRSTTGRRRRRNRDRPIESRVGCSTCSEGWTLRSTADGPADPPPADIARVPARPGAPRSAVLSSMARAESGALVALWYRNILGPDRHLHEVTLGEVRHGRLPVRVHHPLIGEPITIGTVRVTEVEAIEDLDGPDEDRSKFDVGYGMTLGHNERKAIAMANLDIALVRAPAGSPLGQSILMTTDGLDSSGFLEHLKLPHYVTFRSMMERKSAVRRQADRKDPPEAAGDEIEEPA